jgi:hypothetical protein
MNSLTVSPVAARCKQINGPLDTPCHIWQGCKTYSGYGKKLLGKKRTVAHRVAWEQANGPIPPEMFCLHKCDVKLCCNPEHLYIGTRLDNARDAVLRKRMSPLKADKHPLAKLTWAKVRAIRQLHSQGWSQRKLAKRYCVHRSNIYLIVHGYGWPEPTK